MTVFIDYREKKSGVPLMLEKIGVPINVTELKIGDYILGEVAVERKTVNDYLASKISGHLDKQLYELSTNFELSYLFVEGSISEALMSRKMKRAPYISSLIGSSLKRAPDGKQGQIVTVNLENKWDTVLALKFLHDKLVSGGVRLPKIERRKANPNLLLEYIVSSLPGVGKVKAQALLQRFETISNVFSSDAEDLTVVVGKKLAIKIHDLCNEKYKEMK